MTVVLDFNKSNKNEDDISFTVDNITVTVHSPKVTTTVEDNKKRLAQYFYKLMEIGTREAA